MVQRPATPCAHTTLARRATEVTFLLWPEASIIIIIIIYHIPFRKHVRYKSDTQNWTYANRGAHRRTVVSNMWQKVANRSVGRQYDWDTLPRVKTIYTRREQHYIRRTTTHSPGTVNIIITSRSRLCWTTAPTHNLLIRFLLHFTRAAKKRIYQVTDSLIENKTIKCHIYCWWTGHRM